MHNTFGIGMGGERNALHTQANVYHHPVNIQLSGAIKNLWKIISNKKQTKMMGERKRQTTKKEWHIKGEREQKVQ